MVMVMKLPPSYGYIKNNNIDVGMYKITLHIISYCRYDSCLIQMYTIHGGYRLHKLQVLYETYETDSLRSTKLPIPGVPSESTRKQHGAHVRNMCRTMNGLNL